MLDFGQSRKTEHNRTSKEASGSEKAQIDPGTRFSDVADFIRDIHEHMAGLDRALHDEVDRRIASEDRIREQVDAKVKIAIERLADLTETEMARMYRRIEADVMDRVDTLSREVASLSSSLTRLNRQIELVTVETRENIEAVARIEGKRSGTRDGRSGKSDRSSDVVSEMGRDELVKLHAVIENDMMTSKRIEELSDQVNNKMFARLETVEEWLKGNLTPEILRLKEAIRAERTLREDNDREIMEIVAQYTEVMRRHFASSLSTDNADPKVVASKEPRTNHLPPKQARKDEEGFQRAGLTNFGLIGTHPNGPMVDDDYTEHSEVDAAKSGGRKVLEKVLKAV